MRFKSGAESKPRSKCFTAVVIASVFVLRTPSTFAADALLVVNSALNMLTAPLWVAKEKGYFHKYGLDVDTIYIPSGTLGMQALLSGETKILAADGSSVVNARLRGEDVVGVHRVSSVPEVSDVMPRPGYPALLGPLTKPLAPVLPEG